MSKDKIKFITKGLIFIMLTVGLSLLIESFPTQKYDLLKKLNSSLTNQKYDLLKKIDDASSPKNSKIIFLGDSVIERIANTDQDKRSITEFLEAYSGQDIVVVTHDAYHLGVYEAISNYICKNNKSPKLVIIPINLGSFSGAWDLRPTYQFDEDINTFNNYQTGLKIDYLYNRFIKLFEDKRKAYSFDWTEKPVYYNNAKIGIIKDYLTDADPTSLEMIKSKYIFYYLYNLDADHRKIISLKNLIKNYQNCHVPILIYITPLDYQNGEKYVGENFTKIVTANLKVFKKIEETYNIKIHDLTFKLDETYFDHPNSPNEHLNEKGRKYIASYIATEINKINIK